MNPERTYLFSVKNWLSVDTDPETRLKASTMLEQNDTVSLESFFGRQLTFGTAGIRGKLGPGPGGMNAVQVRRVALSVLSHLRDQEDRAGVVVIGYDGRKNSRLFAEVTARVFAAAGYDVQLFDYVVATPVLSFAVVELSAVVGIMVTASHNPPEDNGYKVYWGNGAQIVPPHDISIGNYLLELPLTSTVEPSFESFLNDGKVVYVDERLLENYYERVSAMRLHPSSDLTIVYSAMHGVGSRFVQEVLHRAGYGDLHPVGEQADPDPLFSTVKFPNPEEPGAMDLSFALAERVGAELIVANDPDADRLAVGVPKAGGGYKMLSGNDVGVLLGEYLLRHGEWVSPMVATTVVSSTMLSKIATHYGAKYAETLTGFKWIANQAIAHDSSGGQFVLGYEEALGYSPGSLVRDKDGVSSLLLFVDFAAWCKREGSSPIAELTKIHRRHGVHVSEQVALKFEGSDGGARIEGIMQRVRAELPSSVGGENVVSVNDLAAGTKLDTATQIVSTLDLPRSNVVGIYLANGDRVLVRPSGTEPKIKFYFEVVIPFGESFDESVAAGKGRISILIEELAVLAGVSLK